MKKLTQLFLFTTALTCNYAAAMELALTLSKPHLLVIPGKNGISNQTLDTVLSYFKDNNLKYYIRTPLEDPNFGQKECQKLLEQAMDKFKEEEIIYDFDKIILHASFQNIASAINYTATNPKNIKALILENVILTGNNSIFHTIKNTKESYMIEAGNYILPHTVYLDYSCKRTSNNIDQLPADLLIILVHDSENFQSSFKDAKALYAYLAYVRENKNVYLFEQDSQLNAINTILKLHKLLPKDSSQQMEDVNQYQPAILREWLDHFDEMLNEKENVEYLPLEDTNTNSFFSTMSKLIGL